MQVSDGQIGAESVAKTDTFDLNAGWNELFRENRPIPESPFFVQDIQRKFFSEPRFNRFGCAVARSNTGKFYWVLHISESMMGKYAKQDFIEDAIIKSKSHPLLPMLQASAWERSSETLDNIIQDHNDQVKLNGEQAANQSLSDRLSGMPALLAIGGALLGVGLLGETERG